MVVSFWVRVVFCLVVWFLKSLMWIVGMVVLVMGLVGLSLVVEVGGELVELV